MPSLPDHQSLRRLIAGIAVLACVLIGAWSVWGVFVDKPAGDFDARAGDVHFADGEYEEAIKHFNKALKIQPRHRAALLGKAAALTRLGRFDDAEKVLNQAISFISKNLDPNDPYGLGALAAAYGRRGIVHDAQGRYEQALEDYIEFLKADAGSAAGMGLVNHLFEQGDMTSSIRDRAEYLYRQLQLPEDQRRLGVRE